ncbi:uncharacterized mitochondrial protein AtMg00820-like [Lycium ferocissimum]|uniref:uncharacterized mitochondrial protein AtMg00820-like n=1 Tax=Lycium ferocissimum TaxID=112874 RepID=UPI00281663F1|nr:uncharacterized mitochondrial protein AtMg00820-like [Lycium ferocissimum]
MVTRSQRGIVKPKRLFNLHNTVVKSPLPRNPLAALRDPNWTMAMNDEFDALVRNKTWDLVPRPPNVNVIHSMWIFTHKEKSNGDFERHKARLVGDGKTQQVGIDCDALRRSIMDSLGSEFAMKDLGPLNDFLGIAVTRHKGGMFLSQRKYQEIIDRAGMSSCKPSLTPVDIKPKVGATSGCSL